MRRRVRSKLSYRQISWSSVVVVNVAKPLGVGILGAFAATLPVGFLVLNGEFNFARLAAFTIMRVPAVRAISEAI
jgi:hypothetical protein